MVFKGRASVVFPDERIGVVLQGSVQIRDGRTVFMVTDRCIGV